MDPAALQDYLHEQIPISRAMGVEVVEATPRGVTLAAPLGPNINHQETVFGGSAGAVAILSAWALLHVRLRDEGLAARIVIQRNTMAYRRPITGAFTAAATAPAGAAWARFVTALRRKGRARISMAAVLHCADEEVATLEGDFVAFAR